MTDGSAYKKECDDLHGCELSSASHRVFRCAIAVVLFAVSVAVTDAELIRIPTKGRSMRPVIPENGSVSYDSATCFDDLRSGDIVVYRSKDGIWVVHRLFRRMRGGWWAKGTGNPLPDREYVTPDNLIGRVVAITDGAVAERSPVCCPPVAVCRG